VLLTQWVPPEMRSVVGVIPKLEADVMSGHHHLW